ELSFNLIAWVPGAPTGLFVGIFSERVAPLNHEILNDAMEAGAIVKPFSSQCLEVFDGFGSHVGPKFHDHFAKSGRNAGNFVIHLLNVPASLDFVTRRMDRQRQAAWEPD